jgi:uncharacterized protein involved in response to NO
MSGKGKRENGVDEAAEGGKLRLLTEEPFRIFFPLGILVSVVGVCLWPLLYFGWLPYYPGVSHTRLMMGGFIGAFALGFLGTALPRMMTAPHLRGWELLVLLAAYLVAMVAYGCNQGLLGDAALLFLLAFFFVSMTVRLVWLRQDVPPPGFVLVLLGWLAAMGGLLVFLLEGDPELVLTGVRHRMAGLLFYQGFILLPILGIGAFLFPRFMGLKTLHMFDESRSLPPGWGKKGLFALATGLVVILSFWMEAAGWMKVAGFVRFAAAAWYLWLDVPVFRKANESGTLAFGVRAGLLLLILAFPAAAFFPSYRIGMEHVVFISGFGLIAIMIASRVTLGHSGHADKFTKKLNVMRVVIAAILMAMMTRVVAEFVPSIRVSHLGYAAASWALGVLLWLIWTGRKFLEEEEEE